MIQRLQRRAVMRDDLRLVRGLADHFAHLPGDFRGRRAVARGVNDNSARGCYGAARRKFCAPGRSGVAGHSVSPLGS